MVDKTLKEKWAEHSCSPKTSLRAQLIEAIADHHFWLDRGDLGLGEAAIAMFDEGLWPVLKAAMDNGELLVSRNTNKRVPVPEAAVEWIDGMARLATQVRLAEKTISKRQLLNIVYGLDQSAQVALADIRKHNPGYEKPKLPPIFSGKS